MKLQPYHPSYQAAMIPMICAFYDAHTNFFNLSLEDRKQQEAQAQTTLTAWQKPSHLLFLIIEEAEIYGFVHIAYRSQTVVWIEDIYVQEHYRCHGFATLAIKQAEAMIKQDEHVQAICMDVVSRNQAALHLYHSLGYDNLSLVTLRKECKQNPRDQEIELFDLTFKI